MKYLLLRLICLLVAVCTLLSCGLTALAAEDGLTVIKYKLSPTDEQIITGDGKRQIIRTYILAADESPDEIPRDSFTVDGWQYEFADLTQETTEDTDVKSHIETVELGTDSNDLNEIIQQLSTTLEYESEDGYCGLLMLDLDSIKSEAVNFKNSTYTVTATREYRDLPANDLAYIPKTITDDGRALAFDSVVWETQSVVKMGYSDVPDSYRAVAKYTGTATKSTPTGYITTAEYIGEVTKEIPGDTVYTAYFSGAEIKPDPEEPETATPAPTLPKQDTDSGSMPIVPIIVAAAIIALLAVAAAYFFLHHNVKVYSIEEDGYCDLAAKVRIRMKNPVIDLTPLGDRSESRCFHLEIDKLTAKGLNGSIFDIMLDSATLHHKIAYEGNVYRIEADFSAGTIKAIY